MSFSNLVFDINTPYFTATNTSNNMQYINLTNPSTNIMSCQTDCNSNGDTCNINFPNLCNTNQEKILDVPSLSYSSQACNCADGICSGDITTTTGTDLQYCGKINDTIMCQIGRNGYGNIDGSSAKINYNWGLNPTIYPNPPNIYSGWINCAYNYNFKGFNNTNYIDFQNWLSSILTINLN
jgi:hypothetical protein